MPGMRLEHQTIVPDEVDRNPGDGLDRAQRLDRHSTNGRDAACVHGALGNASQNRRFEVRIGGAGAAFLVAGALLGCVSFVGIAILVRATVMLERARGPR